MSLKPLFYAILITGTCKQYVRLWTSAFQFDIYMDQYSFCIFPEKDIGILPLIQIYQLPLHDSAYILLPSVQDCHKS